jgi:leucyl-tRNA synthetase
MAAEGKQNTARRDQLQQIEHDVQKKWEKLKIFEEDAPDEACEKFMATFPFPYMNGLLHIGHAFSLTKAVFATHFQRLIGKKALFPFGFHCTGMPIQAAANKLKREYEVYGSLYPIFPPGRPAPKEVDGQIELDDEGVTLVWKAPPCTGNKAIKAYHIHLKVDSGDFKKVCQAAHPDPETLKMQGKKVSCKAPLDSGSCVYKITVELADGSLCPESKESDAITTSGAVPKKGSSGGPPGKRVAKKIQAKTGDAAFQWEILISMGLKPEDLPVFTDPLHWLEYYPPLGVRDLKRFGSPIDFRRSFITTEVNKYYDQFIRWQFRKLKASDKIGFGKRATIFSELDGQACMDHDRSEGEGVAPQEYTGIKIKLLEHPKCLDKLKGKTVYLIAATLRPETMVGQTNCWILPRGQYGCFKAGEKNVYVMSHRAARNMSFQDILMPWGKPELLCEVTGQDLMGCKVEAPTCPYEFVHLLPLMTIKMDKGTGIVTSVPSDSPDDFAAFMDLMKPAKRDHFKIKEEWVVPFKLIPIIDVEIDDEIRHEAARYMCEKLGVQSQNDTEKLHEAHDVCYKLGFDKGVMTAGVCKGQPVKVAKLQIRSKMVEAGQAMIYSEPEKKVVSRTGDECVVAGIDQWFLRYGEPAWKKQILDHMNSENWTSYNDRIKDSFEDSIGWLKEWACSRSFGLGTKVPWDEQFLIESLSDSTIYMAYYTIAHFLQGGVLDGANGTSSPEGIKPEDLTDEVFDYIFLDGKLPAGSKIKKPLLEKMKQEFRFWYPMDLRVSGKDLIQNHLTMALYNHACVWEKEPDMWPKGFFCNGWLMVNNEKMSKSKGNFYTLSDIMDKYTADAVRLACANAGDTLEDANLEEKVADDNIMNMHTLLENLTGFLEDKGSLDAGKENKRFVDRWFANEMNLLLQETKKHYQMMYFRKALNTGYFIFMGRFKEYLDICRAGLGLPNKTLVMRYFEWQAIILSPICPHFCEHMWEKLGKTGSVLKSRWPEPTSDTDLSVVTQGKYMFDSVPHEFTKLRDKIGKPDAAVVYVAKNFPDWKVSVLKVMRDKHAAKKLTLATQDDMKTNTVAAEQWKDIIKELMQDPALKKFGKHVGPFAAFKRDEACEQGINALEATVQFDEMTLMQEHAPFLKAKLAVEVTVCAAESPKDPSHGDAASAAQPGKPSVFYAGGAPAAKAKPAKSGGGGGDAKAVPGGKAAPGGKPAKGGAAVGTITDLAALNTHLSTRSYFEDGYAPTAADEAQLVAIASANVSAEQFPHVDRWRRHILSFPSARRSKW